MYAKLLTPLVFLLLFCAQVVAQTPPAPGSAPPAAGTAAPSSDGIAYLFLIDTSKSLTAKQFEQVQTALNAWIEALGPGDRIAIITFGNEVKTQVDFTQSPQLLQIAAARLKLEDTRTKLHTAILRALEVAGRTTGDLPPRRAIVLLSDGVDDYTGAMNREEVVERIKAAKIPIFAIGFANPPATPEKEAALDALKRFAETSHGFYERADKKSVEEIYVEMRRRIRKLPQPAATVPATAAGTGAEPAAGAMASGGDGPFLRTLVPRALRRSDTWRALWWLALVLAAAAALYLTYRWASGRRWQAVAPPVSRPETPAAAPAAPIPAFGSRPAVAYIEHTGGVHAIQSFPCTVGAVRDNDIVIGHESVSRYHATLEFRQGKFFVTDRDSTNGTRVSGKEVKEAEIGEGSRLAFGHWEGVFRVGNPADRRQRAPAVAAAATKLALPAPLLLGVAGALAAGAAGYLAYWLIDGRGAGEEFQDALDGGGRGPVMVVVPGGAYFMGDQQRKGKPNEQPVHEVEVEAFAIGKYEITFAEYDYYCQMTGKPKPDDKGAGRGMNPVINVSWKDAIAYTRWLSEKTGNRYRLPTEAEWEYAARGGSSSAFWWGDTGVRDNGNFGQDSCCGPGTGGADRYPSLAPVGSFPANRFRLHDTSGNVFEWTCSNITEPYAGQESVCNDDDTLRKIFRGGSWATPPDYSRSSWRQGRLATEAAIDQGFRVVMEL